MSAHLARARLLLAQSRHADAEREAGLALAEQPDHTGALAVLALSRLEQEKPDAALEAATAAVGLAPDEAHLHYVHAFVLHRLDREKDARAAAQEALRLDPADADNFSLLASIELSRRDWPAALSAAEQALALNPEHIGAANLRAMALVRLGRKEEAAATVDFALHRAPENAFSHANQGWTCLHQNDPRKAQEHFLEALRLEPELEYARQGMLEALKARNPIYRAMLAYFLWIGRQGPKFQGGFVVAVWFGGKFLRNLVRLQPTLWPLLLLFYIAIYLSWTAGPMFNLLLRLDRFGRHVLSSDQRIGSNFFGVFFTGAAGGLVWAVAGGGDPAEMTASVCAALSICVAVTFNFERVWRRIFGGVTVVLTMLAVLIVANAMIATGTTGNPTADFSSAEMYFMLGFIAVQILATVRRL